MKEKNKFGNKTRERNPKRIRPRQDETPKKKFASKDVNQEEQVQDNFTVVGKNPVQEALRSGQNIDKILILKDNKDHVLKEISEKAKKRGLVVQTVERVKLENLAEGQPHQGVAALMAPYPYQTIDDILNNAKKKGEEPLIVIMDHITDPHNFGAIIRSANLCGVHGIIFPKRRSATITPTSVKASSGAMAYTPLVKVTNLAQVVKELKAKGFWIMAADMDGQPYYKNDFKGKLALIIGSEGNGISPILKKESDLVTSIPLYGDIDSFNASNAAAIILSEAARQRHI